MCYLLLHRSRVMRRRTTSSNKNHIDSDFFSLSLRSLMEFSSEAIIYYYFAIQKTYRVPQMYRFICFFFASFRFDSVRFTGAQQTDSRTAYERTQLDVVCRQISLEMIFVRAERTC